MYSHTIGNALAGIIFLVIATVDYTKDTSGIGTVFLVFAAVFLGLAFTGKKHKQ
jgi:FtsH-binding integral membrane protein